MPATHPEPPSPSRTSQTVALVRAELLRPCTPDGDPEAQRRLCAGMAPVGAFPLRAHLAARTRFIDDRVLAAIERGVDQVVLLGAGYDDRSLRFRTPGVRFFELDHPDTQADKRRRLTVNPADLTGVTLAPADFRTDDVAEVLAAAGHRSDRSSLFVAEGLLVYLDEETISALLGAARTRSAPGSSLAATLAVHPDGIDSATVVRRANAGRPQSGTEPWRTILTARHHLGLLSRSGWSAVELVDDASIDPSALPGRSLLVVAVAADRVVAVAADRVVAGPG
jgi:methyltransferase (TIGR00027 family)